MTDRTGPIATPRRGGPALTCLVLTCLVAALPARAQPTNLEAFQHLALRCLAEAPDTARVLQLNAPAQMPYLRTALTQQWRREGRILFVADSTVQLPGVAASRLYYRVEEAGVAYARAPAKQLARTVRLALHYTLTAPDGRLLRDDRCREDFSDTIARAAQATLESPAFPETQGAAPRGGWARRYLEPAVLAVATAVAVYLFFNLRSDRSDGG